MNIVYCPYGLAKNMHIRLNVIVLSIWMHYLFNLHIFSQKLRKPLEERKKKKIVTIFAYFFSHLHFLLCVSEIAGEVELQTSKLFIIWFKVSNFGDLTVLFFGANMGMCS